MRILLLFLVFVFNSFFSIPAIASHADGHKELSVSERVKQVPGTEHADHIITVQINGLVCDFCARAIEKVFGKRPEVSGIDVNLDTKIVTIGFKKDANIDDTTITKLITDSGYSVVKINR